MSEHDGYTRPTAAATGTAYFADTDPEFEWDPTEQGGVFRGRRAITELAENWFSTWEEWQWEPEEIELTSNG